MSSIKDNEPEALFQEEQTDKKLKIVVDNDHLKPDTSEMTLLVDADTVAYATCSACEYGDDESGWFIDLPSALIVAQEKVALLLELSGCKDVELHFTSGKNFRYLLTDTYKSNRSSTRYPEGLREMKDLLEGTINTDYEADDIVCMLKREYPDKYIVCAVDKDVLNGVPGIHFNYYNSLKYNINMKWLVTDEETSTQWPYLQCLMGDSADGITGIKGVGPAKAKKLLLGITDETIMWNTVKQAYTDAGQEESEALLNMRLVHMHQLTKDKELHLWTPPMEQ